jgi:serine/threonine protein kinase/Tol biopolymer transport system component
VIGTTLGRYRITGELGAGGMGEVWRAEDTKLEREVALKVLPEEFAKDPRRMARFEREAKVLASLNHPNIATLYGLESVEMGSGTESGTGSDSSPEPRASSPVTFLAMELVEGEDLSERIARGTIPADEAIPIALQIAEALEAAHEQGIVHRDLKPANIKITDDDVVKVLDFGLAKAWESDSNDSSLSLSPTMTAHATAAGVVLGTAAYMSPEQARGKKVDRRADIWSFGVVLWEMLTGDLLFEGETVTDILAAVVRQDIDSNQLPRETPRRVCDLVDRCLDRDPHTRLRDIGEARIALAAQPPTEEGERRPEPGSTLMTRRSFAVTSAMTGAGFVLGLGVGHRFMGRDDPGASNTVLEITRLTGSGNVTSVAISPDGRFIAFTRLERGLQSLWLRQVASGQTLRLISEEEQSFWGHTFSRDGNDIIYALKTPGDQAGAIYSISALGGPQRRLADHVDSTPALSYDGHNMAWLRAGFPSANESALMVAAADGSEARTLAVFELPEIAAPIFFTGPAWAPDGTHIVTAVGRFGGDTAQQRSWLVSVDSADGKVATLADPGWVQAAHSGYLPDGRSLLVVARARHQLNTQIWHVDAQSGEASPVTNDLNDHRIISFSADGSSLASIVGDVSSAVWVGSLDGSEPPRRISWGRVDGSRGVCFTPSGHVVYTSNDRGVWGLSSIKPDGSESIPILAADPGETILGVVVAGNGDLYYNVRNDFGLEIRVADANGSARRTVVTGVGNDWIDVSRDGALVYASAVAGERRLFLLESEYAEPRQITDFEVYGPTIEPSGRRVAFFFTDDADQIRVGVVATASGELIWSAQVATPGIFTHLCLREEGLYLTSMPGDRTNVWLMPLDGGQPERLTDFEDQRLWHFAVSDDGRMLAVARGRRDRDAVLIKGFRGSSTGESA